MSDSNDSKPGYVPPLYGKFGKSLKDLFKKKYLSGRELSLSTGADNGNVTFESSATYDAKKGDYGGKLVIKDKVADVGDFEVELNTSGKVSGSAELKKLSKGLVVKTTFNEQPSATIDADLRREFFSLSGTAFIAQNKTTLNVAGVLGFDGLSVGGNTKLDYATQQVEDYNAGVEYAGKEFTVTVQTQDQADAVAVSYIHNVNHDLDVGAKFNYNIASGSRSLVFGGAYTVDRDTLVKAKADSNGSTSWALEQRSSNPNLTYGISATFDATSKSTVPTDFGLKVQFGD